MNEKAKRFIRLRQVKDLVGLGRSAIYQKIKSGEFPRPYPLSDNGRAVAWLSDDVNKWIESRIKAGA